jgi:hypothetical protein
VCVRGGVGRCVSVCLDAKERAKIYTSTPPVNSSQKFSGKGDGVGGGGGKNVNWEAGWEKYGDMEGRGVEGGT